jgi:hypothetical protein
VRRAAANGLRAAVSPAPRKPRTPPAWPTRSHSSRRAPCYKYRCTPPWPSISAPQDFCHRPPTPLPLFELRLVLYEALLGLEAPRRDQSGLNRLDIGFDCVVVVISEHRSGTCSGHGGVGQWCPCALASGQSSVAPLDALVAEDHVLFGHEDARAREVDRPCDHPWGPPRPANRRGASWACALHEERNCPRWDPSRKGRTCGPRLCRYARLRVGVGVDPVAAVFVQFELAAAGLAGGPVDHLHDRMVVGGLGYRSQLFPSPRCRSLPGMGAGTIPANGRRN